MTGEPAVSVRGLRKAYGDNEAVRGVSFEVAHGECFGFLGPNGAGKTTTIEILEGYRKRTAGEASVLGMDPGKPTRAWRDRIGLVLQECEMEPTLTVRETVKMFSNYYSRPRDVDETVELVGLKDKAKARVGSLSGGQRRRVDVAVGIIGDPELIFLDEPTTGFDPSARRQSWNMLEGLKALGKTIFLTTHYMEEAQHLADRVVIIRRGEIVAEGRPEELTGGDGDGTTVIRFRLPEGVAAAELDALFAKRLQVSGVQASVRSESPQEELYGLLSLARDRKVELSGLEVERPSLEDIFLELVSEEGE